MACNLCGENSYCLVYQKALERSSTVANDRAAGYRISEERLNKPRRLFQCLRCGLVYADLTVEDKAKISHDYAAMEDSGYLKEEAGRRAQAREILKSFKARPGGRLLDLGCGPGFFLDEAKKLGWTVLGVDISKWAAECAKNHYGIDVFCGSLFDAHLADQSFDLIVMNDAIEHLEDPKGVLIEVRRILKNDGFLYISTPDIGSIFSILLRAKWWGINRYHLFYFSKKTLKQLLREVGFRDFHFSSYPRIFSLGYWSERVRVYPRWATWPFTLISKLKRFNQSSLKIDLGDQIAVTTRKTLRLDSFRSEQTNVAAPSFKQKVIAVLPAYNAEKTLERTVADIPKEVVSEIILVDDASHDRTVQIAEKLGLTVYRHSKNLGYGGNQKTCYEKALEHGADIVVMCHPDYQYDPKIIPELVRPIAEGRADAVFGSRMMKGGALEGGMPLWKHNANIMLTAFENVVLGAYLSEYHSGFRAYSARLLRTVRYKENSDGFIFDTEIIIQALANYFRIEEVPIRTRYFEEASSIKFWPSVRYGLGIVRSMGSYWLHTHSLKRNKKLDPQ